MLMHFDDLQKLWDTFKREQGETPLYFGRDRASDGVIVVGPTRIETYIENERDGDWFALDSVILYSFEEFTRRNEERNW